MTTSVTIANDKKSFVIQILPVMLCFFAMGFVDLVGTASNYVQKDLGLTDSQANLFPSLVFFWFLIFSVPTGMLMNRIGRKKTVLISLVITALSLVIPVTGDSYAIMLVSFSLLGIGNAVMQTSLNPLVSNLIGSDKLASTLTFGQFVKAIASFLAPVLAAWGATTYLPTFGLGWRALFVIYAVVSIFSISALAATPIREERPDKASGVGECLKLLGRPFIFLCFLGIMCHVGIDVGTNTTAPKIIMERLGLPLEEAGFATGIYFIFRTAGCFLGAFLLRAMSARIFFAISVVMMLAGMTVLFTGSSLMPLYVGIALIGFGNSNIFSVVFSQALLDSPAEKNEVSGLMIMGLFGGTIFPLAMGFAADAVGQAGAVAVMTVGVIYLLYYTIKIKSNK
nr:MFS transporter [uncultured Muribaculaceae bacterium]